MADLDSYSGFFVPFTLQFVVLRPIRTQLSCRHQFPSHYPHIAQGKQRHDLRRVLGQSFVPNLAVTELALQDVKRMFHLGTYRSLEFLDAFDGVAYPFVLDRQALARFHGHMPDSLDVLRVLTLVSPKVSRVTIDNLFFAMHQSMRLRDMSCSLAGVVLTV